MRYKVGDRVRIKSIEWFNENKNDEGWVGLNNRKAFFEIQSYYCGEIMTIATVYDDGYDMVEDEGCDTWYDEVIECKIEENTDVISIEKYVKCTVVENVDGEERLRITINDEFEMEEKDGQLFIVKKKIKYPKTYEECLKLLKLDDTIIEGCIGYEYKLISKLQKLIVCRDAYWKLIGDWRPSTHEIAYSIYRLNGYVVGGEDCFGCTNVLEFPTQELRDVFYRNFEELIFECKELL
jgi:hypothetical protein